MRTVEDLVRVEVHYCVSSLVSTLAAGWNVDHVNPEMDALHEQAQQLAYPIEDWQEAASQEGWKWDEGGPHFYRTSPGASAFAPYEYQHIKSGDWQELCDAEFIEPYQWEVFEHWIVSDWLGEALAAKGEKVDEDFAGLTVWARTTTGQAIAMDAVIQQIHSDLMKG